MAKTISNNAINSDAQKCRFALLLYADYGERYLAVGDAQRSIACLAVMRCWA